LEETSVNVEILEELRELREKSETIERAGWAMWLLLRQLKQCMDITPYADELDHWVGACAHQSEDGHLKVYCYNCGHTEHAQNMNEHGICVTCAVKRGEG
jgi:hypothetical protein